MKSEKAELGKGRHGRLVSTSSIAQLLWFVSCVKPYHEVGTVEISKQDAYLGLAKEVYLGVATNS